MATCMLRYGTNIYRRSGLANQRRSQLAAGINAGGFGTADNSHIVSLEIFGRQAVVGTSNSSTGGEIWRTSNGTSWEPLMSTGRIRQRGQLEYMAGLIPFHGEYLCSSHGNFATGLEVWRSPSGSSGSWQKVGQIPVSAPAISCGPLGNHGTTVFDGSLYIGHV